MKSEPGTRTIHWFWEPGGCMARVSCGLLVAKHRALMLTGMGGGHGRCATCLAAETNAMLNGRDCNTCDCLCANWPIDALYTRRYVRAKYGLALRLQRNPFSSASWTGTYWDDFGCVPSNAFTARLRQTHTIWLV